MTISRLYILSLFLSSFSSSKAQVLSDFHSLRIGDQFSKEVVTFKSLPTNDEQGNIWNISDIKSNGKNVSVEYIAAPKIENGIIGIEDNTRYLYLAKGLDIVLKAYENKLTKVVYNAPELAFSSSMFLGYQKDSVFYGNCTYSEKVNSQILGQ